jgi:hypothetical protein
MVRRECGPAPEESEHEEWNGNMNAGPHSYDEAIAGAPVVLLVRVSVPGKCSFGRAAPGTAGPPQSESATHNH